MDEVENSDAKIAKIYYLCKQINDMEKKDYFATRRTVRKYTDQPVSEKMINSIVERAMRAPTCGNMQLYTIIATRDTEMKKRLAEAHFNQPCALGCSVMLTVCADYARFSRWCELSDAKPGYDNFLSFTSAMTDAVILAQQIVTIAEMEGLGTCYLGTVTYNATRISEILELPELVVPVACITLGYPAAEGDVVERLPVEACLNFETYRKNSDEEIMTLYKAKDEFPDNQKYIEENGKKTLAQVFTDIRYPKAMNEEFSKTFLDLLKQKRFL